MDEGSTELAHTHWSWPEAILANPAKSLANADLAFDYFAWSPFFDIKSNNGVLRTQRKVENPTYGHAEEKYELNAFRSGFEYVVSHALPPRLFVIQRRDVSEDGSREKNVTATYIIMDDRIYASPSVYDVMSVRLKNASYLISTTFQRLSENRPSSNPRAQSSWRSLPPSAPPAAPNAEASSSRLPASMTEDGDISMALSPALPSAVPDGGEPAALNGSPVEKATEPDVLLFHALSSTRAALPSLAEASRQPAKTADPREELRAMEAQLLSSTSSATDNRRQGTRSVTSGSLVPPVRGWSDPSLSNTPSGPRPVGVLSSVAGLSPRPLASTPGLSPVPRA